MNPHARGELRVLFLVSEYVEKGNPLGGIFFRDQALMLKKRGLRVDVVYVEPRSLRQLSARSLRENHFQVTVAEEDGILTVRRRGWNPMMRAIAGGLAWSWMTERLVRRYLRLFGRPDIVHAQNTIWAGHIARRVCEATRLPYVVTEHSSLFLMGKTPGGARGYIERALKKAARVLAVSSKLAESMKPFVRDREIEIVPNLVDLGFFTIGSPRGETPYVFLAASHLNKNKGVDALVRSFACGFRGDRSTRLHIGGDGPERRSLEALVAELGVGEQVFFLGHLARTGVREAMWGANALVHPSHNETFGIVLIEALATGIPVIATRCGGPEDIVTEELGILVDPGSVEQLAAALRTMRATRRYSSADLRENVARRFGAEAVGRRLEGIYQEAIAAGKTASAGSP